jgi:hypothetical protein
MARYKRKPYDNRDDNEPEIVEALEKAGWEAHRTLPLDLLLIGPDGEIRLQEVKNIDGKNEVTEEQQRIVDKCEKADLVWSPEDALEAIGRI